MTRAWRDLAIGVLGIIAAGFLLRIVSEPFRVDANTYRVERLEEISDQHERRIARLEVRHEPAIEHAPAIPTPRA
jgi:hypothetical protein